ncbi:MAG: T9SS type A sorting domain-containing protein [Saprospiraceae bacterium]|nr:T9SS type A sorting domain-containing protein [Saprospiraceae bacterium]
MIRILLIIILSAFSILCLHGQNLPDRHSTNVYDSWVSCQLSANPNPLRGPSHWIKYDLGSLYSLGKSKMWNYNHPNNLNRGLQQIVVDVSLNGITWSQAGSFILDKADASGFYVGQASIDFQGINARYVLITALSNYGDPCYGFGELKITLANGPLPVILTNFEGDCLQKKLYWQTSLEINNDYFEIELSTDAIYWQKLDVIPNKPTGHTINNYDYNIPLDISFPAYFRLKQYDLNQTSSYSPIIKLNCENDDILSIFPNPTSDIIYIETDKSVKAGFELINTEGRVIFRGAFQEGKTQLSIAQYPSGKYIIKCTLNGRDLYRDIVKI